MLNFRIPKELKIGGIVYKVVVTDNWMDREGADGMIDSSNNTIHIHSGLSPEFQAITMIHESLHAMNSVMSHEFLDSLSEQIYAFLIDNKFIKIK